MKCPQCQHENEVGANFCEECAAPLARACTNCGRQLSSTAKFCPGCAHPTELAPEPPAAARWTSPEIYTPRHLAEKILTSKAALEGERKQVTALFADLKGSMELFADRDPEEARKLLDPVLDHMMEAVHRYEGTVIHVLGDGIVALFGAPLAHEDHAVRGCYAALRMQETVRHYAEDVRRSEGILVQIRVGLNSGEVVVRSIGSDLRMDYTVVGQTINVAARMEQIAVPGTILIPPDTLALAEGYIKARPLGPMRVKGLELPLAVYEVTGANTVRSRLHAAAARGLTPFVGRDAELEQLWQALEGARGGHGQVVAIVGEAGVGKSRLNWEFIHSHRTEGWLIVESSSGFYRKPTSFLPIIDLLKAYFQIEADDEVRKIREKVTGKLFSLDRTLEPCLAPLLWLLDVPVEDLQWQEIDPARRRQQALDGVKRLLLRESQVQPLLAIFEDLHWIDAETQALLDSLVASLPTASLLLLVNYRPEYRHEWSAKSYYRQVQIGPLPLKGIEELLDSLLGDDAGLQPLKRLLVERAEGNPFFLEESVRTLVEKKALTGERGAYRNVKPLKSLEIPATAQAILAARIDRLSAEDKRLLQTASVIGKNVPYSLLQTIAALPQKSLQSGVARLQAAEFLYEARLFPDLEYSFKHALTHEVAYGSLLRERRRRLHAKIMETLERFNPDGMAENIEQLAYHAFRGEVWEKAVPYLRQAGQRAAARSALQDARTWFEQALNVLEGLSARRSTLEEAFGIRLELRIVLTQLGELQRALEHLRQADALAAQLEDERFQGQVSAGLMTIHSALGELDEAVVAGTRALDISERLGDLRLRIPTTSYLEQAHYYRGEYERVVELAKEALAALPADWANEHFGMHAPASVYARSWLVISLSELGRFSEAIEHGADAIRLAELSHHSYTRGLAHRAVGTLHLLKGDWTKARSLFDHGIAVLRSDNVVLSLAPTLCSSAWALAQLGDANEAASRLQEGEETAERLAAMGRVQYRGWDYHALARACLMLGRLDEAQNLGMRSVELLASQPGAAAHGLHLLGDIATHPDRFDGECGEVRYREALALAEPRGMRPLVAHCHLGLGKLHRLTGKGQEAQEHLAAAACMYREMEMTFWLDQAEKELR